LRPKSQEISEEEISIETFSNRPFDSEGIEVAKSEAVFKPSENAAKVLERMKNQPSNPSTSGT